MVVKINRLEKIVGSSELQGIRIIVTGCGYKPANHVFCDVVKKEPTHDAIFIDGLEMKLNIGASTSAVLAKKGAIVHMVSKSEHKLVNMVEYFQGTGIRNLEFSALDLTDQEQVEGFINRLKRDKNLYWVQSLGLGAGSYEIPNDNPYLPLGQIPLGLIEAELQVVQATHTMMTALLPILETQEGSRIAVVSSMSAIRGYSVGGAHCAAKGAIDRYANAAMLELYKRNIFLTTIRPGAIDTGMYDDIVVQEAVKNIADEYGCDWRTDGIRLAPPTSVGIAVALALTSEAHIPSINLVAKGQFPNEGS